MPSVVVRSSYKKTHLGTSLYQGDNTLSRIYHPMRYPPLCEKEYCPELATPFKKITELAAELICSFEPPSEITVLVLFDSYYLCPTVMRTCRDRKFHFLSTLKSNRNLFVGGRKLKAGTCGTNLYRQKSKSTLKVQKNRCFTQYRYVDAGWIAHPTLDASQMIPSYEAHWSIEAFFKGSKQLLGLGQYQNHPYRAAVTPLHLVRFAYALLTHIALESSCAQEKQ
jgi:hypothetical protein